MKLGVHHRHKTKRYQYQLKVIFLFIAGLFLLFPYYLLLQVYNKDLSVYQWYFIIPWLIIYTLYCLQARNKIPIGYATPASKRPIGHWILLGITMIAMHINHVLITNYIGLDIAFLVFSLFLADSYWDFQKEKNI